MADVAMMEPLDHGSEFDKPSRLLQLPDEVKLEIVKHVEQRRDLYNLSLACHSMEDVTLGRLYQSIDLDIPNSESQPWFQSTLPTFRPLVLQNMRELAIRNGFSDWRNPGYRKSDADTVEGYVGEIFKGVPEDRLNTFSFLHPTPMSLQMLGDLTKQHGNGLKHLQCCELELLSNPQVSLPSNLESLECRSVLSGEVITMLIRNNKTTLRSLSLGQDKYLLQQYCQRRIGFLDNVPQPFASFTTPINLNNIPNLKSLSLSGLDLRPITPLHVNMAHCLTILESLTLESCTNTEQFLDILTETFTHPDTSKEKLSLRKFSFRHESFARPLKDSLVRFLNSFTGLHSLTILIENSNFNSPLSTVIKPHGQTLTHLVLESRIKPRERVHIDTSRPLGMGDSSAEIWEHTFSDITTLCPNLVELGTAFPWDAPNATYLAGLLADLPLHTLHIRNFPVSSNRNTLAPDHLTNHAREFLAWCPLPLQTFAIGPTLAPARYRLDTSLPQSMTAAAAAAAVTNSNTTTNTTTTPASEPTTPVLGPTIPGIGGTAGTSRARSTLAAAALATAAMTGATAAAGHKKHDNPPDHLRTHYFTVDVTADPVDVRSVSEKYVQSVRGRRGLGGVFDAVWLR